ncbi:MAG: recombinase family protein [Mycobacterium sp.]
MGLRSLAEQIDTSTAAGRLVLHIFGVLAEFERSLMRTITGLAASRARGRVGGRPPALSAAQLTMPRHWRLPGHRSVKSPTSSVRVDLRSIAT